MTTAELFYNKNTDLYYRVQPSGVVECSPHRNMTKSVRSSYTAGEVRENQGGQFEQVMTNQAKNAWKSETVTVEVPKQNALVGHIEELQRVITRRNKRIEELEAQLNAEADEEPQLAEPGIYKMHSEESPMRWLKTASGDWYVFPGGNLKASSDTAPEWEADNFPFLERIEE